jgi:Uma2 family endonuclease
MYAYPDIVAICGEPEFLDSELDTLLNPVLIIEVLSPTKNDDRGEKFERYRLIPSFREYLLVAQDRIHVERFLKQDDGTWVRSETNSAVDIVDLSSVGYLYPRFTSRCQFRIPLHPSHNSSWVRAGHSGQRNEN